MLRAVKLGFLNTVCTMGTSLSDTQVDIIKKLSVPRVILFGDGDTPGIVASKAQAEKLLLADQAVYVVHDHVNDPDSIGSKDPTLFSNLLLSAVPATTFLFRQLDLHSSTEYGKAADYFRKLLKQVADPNRRMLLANEVSSLLGISFKVEDVSSTRLPDIKEALAIHASAKDLSFTLEIKRIELDIIFCLLKHFRTAEVFELVLQLPKYNPGTLFSSLGGRTINFLLSCFSEISEMSDTAVELEVFSKVTNDELIISACERALQLNEKNEINLPRFTNEVIQWCTVELAKHQLEQLKHQLMSESTLEHLMEYVEISRKRIG